MSILIVQGSSNPNGNTATIVKILADKLNAEVLDLTTKNILPFDYQFKNQEDDFNSTAHDIFDHFDTIIFASPVYWYTMSGIMKSFMDRLTDGLLYDKALGQKYENKNMAAIACGSSQVAIEGYFIPFQKSATYLKMNYLGDVHLWIDEVNVISPIAEKRLHAFTQLF